MITLLLIVVAVLAVLFMIYAARGTSPAVGSPQDLKALTQAIDIEAFRNLVSLEDEEYLRQHLPPREFRRVQRARLLTTISYVKIAASNAAVLLRLAEAGRVSPDARIAASAGELANSAIEMRFHAIVALAKLYAALLSPGFTHSSVHTVERYQSFAQRAVHFVSLSAPAHTSHIASAI